MVVVGLLEQEIPRFTIKDLSQIYPNELKVQQTRYEQLILKFQQEYGHKPDFICRSPGRVNLIGEHVDYSGYSVLPMAIEKDVIMAVKSVESKEPLIEISNINEKFIKREFKHLDKVHCDIDSNEHEWGNYFKCGYKGIMEELNKEAKSMQIMMDGSVPAGGGLSSSSAFVCCSALATLNAHDNTLKKGQLTKIAIKSEQYAGVAIGGMDQSISIMALQGSALMIDFYPSLEANIVELPKSDVLPVFVIANTMVTSDKHVTAPKHYNLRVVEVRLAAAMLLKKLDIKKEGILTLKQVHELYLGLNADPIHALERMVQISKEYLKTEPYTLDEIAEELELTVDELSSTFIKGITIQADNFRLRDRACHVYSEALLVYKFKQVCSTSNQDQLKELGTLMNQSHTSCRELFDCSCPELDELTNLARQSGAFGSRLTGAGWGKLD